MTRATPPVDGAAGWFCVTSDPTVQITVYDATQTIRGRREGNLRLLLAPGLYRVHLERGGIVHKEIVDHENATNLEDPGPPLRSPVPFSGAATSHAYYVDLAQRLCVEDTGPPLGGAHHTSRLFIFLRRAERSAPPAELPSEPVTIHDGHGRPLATISRSNAEIDNELGCVAFSARVSPGSYRIRGGRSRRDAAVTIPDRRAAHVFVADTGGVRLDDLRISLVPVDARFNPRSRLWSVMERMIAALAAPDGSLPIAARALLPEAIDEDLCFGITAAILLSRRDDGAAFHAVMQRLASYREIPDVAILERLHRLHQAPVVALTSPPMLRASLILAMTRLDLDSPDTPDDCAMAQAARRRFHDSVWCTWSARMWDERWIEPTVERLRTLAGDRNAAAIAHNLALPRETVERALRALGATSEGGTQPHGGAELVVPGYVLGTMIGRGTRSTVYRATRVSDQRAVALKLVRTPGGGDECARVERKLDARDPETHPRIVAAGAHGRLPGDAGIWIEMELCWGSALDLLSEADTPLPVEQACRLVCDALAGLAQLHRRGIVHGGIKPENLLVRDDASGAITQFGPLLADDAKPEVASDVWSMAATLYFLLTLETPRDEYVGQTPCEAARGNPIVSIAMRRPERAAGARTLHRSRTVAVARCSRARCRLASRRSRVGCAGSQCRRER